MSEEGFIRLSRRAFQHFLWKEPREKSRWEAWVDLIQSAAYAPETVLVKGRRISLVRGELVASVRYLAVRWGWDKNRVGRFLDMLKDETMIESRIETGVSVLRLCKYDHYNPLKDRRGTPGPTESGTVAGQRRDSDGTNRRREEEEENALSPAREPEPAGSRPGEQPSLEQPSLEQPSLGQPSLGQPSLGQPSLEQPSLGQFVAECARYSIPAWYAEQKFQNFAAKGWKSGATPVVWREVVRNWVVRDYGNDGRPPKPTTPPASAGNARKTHELTTKPNNGF